MAAESSGDRGAADRALLLACTAGDLSLVQSMLTEGFPLLHCRDQELWTPLMRAIVSSSERARDIIKVLLTSQGGSAQVRAQNRVRAVCCLPAARAPLSTPTAHRFLATPPPFRAPINNTKIHFTSTCVRVLILLLPAQFASSNPLCWGRSARRRPGAARSPWRTPRAPVSAWTHCLPGGCSSGWPPA